MFKSRLQKFAAWMDSLKHDKKALIVLIVLDLFKAVGSNVTDWPWLNYVVQQNPIVLPLTPICSLYPLLLAIWFILYYKNKKIPQIFTNFIYIGIISYGLMSLFYFPAYMTWDGFKLMTVGNMFWVFTYALQSLIIKSQVKSVPAYQYAIIFAYFVLKDYSDRFLGSFIDVTDPTYPESFKSFFFSLVIIIHFSVIAKTIHLASHQRQHRFP